MNKSWFLKTKEASISRKSTVYTRHQVPRISWHTIHPSTSSPHETAAAATSQVEWRIHLCILLSSNSDRHKSAGNEKEDYSFCQRYSQVEWTANLSSKTKTKREKGVREAIQWMTVMKRGWIQTMYVKWFSSLKFHDPLNDWLRWLDLLEKMLGLNVEARLCKGRSVARGWDSSPLFLQEIKDKRSDDLLLCPSPSTSSPSSQSLLPPPPLPLSPSHSPPPLSHFIIYGYDSQWTPKKLSWRKRATQKYTHLRGKIDGKAKEEELIVFAIAYKYWNICRHHSLD